MDEILHNVFVPTDQRGQRAAHLELCMAKSYCFLTLGGLEMLFYCLLCIMTEIRQFVQGLVIVIGS